MAQLDRLLDRYDLKSLEAALARRRARERTHHVRLAAKKRKLEAELRKIERLTSGNSIAAPAKAGRKGGRKAGRKASGKVKRRPNARRLNEISLADALERVMTSRKKPIHYKDLTEAVVQRKLYRTRSKSLLSTVAVTLKRDKRFKKVEPGLYALR